MLKSLRSSSKNIFVKILLVLIALTFVAWGIGDMFTAGGGAGSIKAGNYEISRNEIDGYVQNQAARYQQMTGKVLTEQEIKQFGIRREAVNAIVRRRLLLTRADDLDLMIGDEIVKQRISTEPLFKDENGKFNPELFNSVLKANNFTEERFINIIKGDEKANLLLSAFEYEPKSLQTSAKISYNYQNEKRAADIITIAKNAVGDAPEPSKEEITQYYEDNKSFYVIPETRAVTYVKYGLENIAKNIQISEEDIKAEYQENIAYFTEPKKIDIDQYLLDSEEKATEIHTKLTQDKEAIIEEQIINLEGITADALPKELSDKLFEAETGKYLDPIKTDLGWHIVMVNKVIESKPKPIEEVKEEIKKFLEESKSNELFYESVSEIEDEFASGKNISEIAEKFNLEVSKVDSINQNGQNNKGEQIDGLPETNIFVPLVFNTEMEETSPFTLLSDNQTYVALEIDKIEPLKQKELDEVKSQIIKNWKLKYIQDKHEEIAKEIAQKIKDGENIAAFEGKEGFKLESDVKVSRSGDDSQNDGLPYSLRTELFQINKGESTDFYRADSGKFVIAKLKYVIDAKEDKEQIKAKEKTLKNDFAQDLVEQYNIFLSKEYPIDKDDFQRIVN